MWLTEYRWSVVGYLTSPDCRSAKVIQVEFGKMIRRLQRKTYGDVSFILAIEDKRWSFEYEAKEVSDGHHSDDQIPGLKDDRHRHQKDRPEHQGYRYVHDVTASSAQHVHGHCLLYFHGSRTITMKDIRKTWTVGMSEFRPMDPKDVEAFTHDVDYAVKDIAKHPDDWTISTKMPPKITTSPTSLKLTYGQPRAA